MVFSDWFRSTLSGPITISIKSNPSGESATYPMTSQMESFSLTSSKLSVSRFMSVAPDWDSWHFSNSLFVIDVTFSLTLFFNRLNVFWAWILSFHLYFFKNTLSKALELHRSNFSDCFCHLAVKLITKQSNHLHISFKGFRKYANQFNLSPSGCMNN